MGVEMPYDDETSAARFPPVSSATEEGIVAAGGNLSPGVLLSAYRQGIFPWFSEGDPILWWSPDPRCVLFPKEIHISRSMRKLLARGRFGASLDTRFDEVITSCSTVPRRGQDGTWITAEMRHAYRDLHRLGYAHSIEVWDSRLLVGGLYGVSMGSFFFGESMFSKVANASKAALIMLSRFLEEHGFDLLDCQVYSPHLERMGARLISREEFMNRLSEALKNKTIRGSWSAMLRRSARTQPAP
jgi:leucyl/phenylalanyl-tRNA--protein transferase